MKVFRMHMKFLKEYIVHVHIKKRLFLFILNSDTKSSAEEGKNSGGVFWPGKIDIYYPYASDGAVGTIDGLFAEA